jgi:hypothetical protein
MGMIKRKKPAKKKKDFKRNTYVETLDSVFSHYIRQGASNDAGFAGCYTCESIMPWQAMQNGHFFSRTSLSTRWSEMNSRCQCPSCNVFHSGNYPIYGVRLAREIGAEGMESLERLNKQTVKLSNIDLLEDIKFYYGKLRWPEQISQGLRLKLKQLKVI